MLLGYFWVFARALVGCRGAAGAWLGRPGCFPFGPWVGGRFSDTLKLLLWVREVPGCVECCWGVAEAFLGRCWGCAGDTQGDTLGDIQGTPQGVVWGAVWGICLGDTLGVI